MIQALAWLALYLVIGGLLAVAMVWSLERFGVPPVAVIFAISVIYILASGVIFLNVEHTW